MATTRQLQRRLISRRFAIGGVVFCTFLDHLHRQTARAAPPGLDDPRRQSARTAQSGPGEPRRWSGEHLDGSRHQAALDGRAASRPAPLVILDPGHGGRDAGATGVTGTLEKEVTLATALTLKAALEARGRYRVELTRTLDQYVAREDRVSIARDLGASLFLSLHADSMSDASVRGASVYTLARRASDIETEALADRENGLVPGEDGRQGRVASEVSEILASLAARETRAASSRIAHQLVNDLQLDLPVLPSPERHANFIVLHAAGIPSVLVEMGYLSNPAEEAALNDPGHRDLIARSMTRAVDAWFSAAREGGAV